MNVVLAAVIQELEAAVAVCDRRATFIQVLYSDSTITLIPLPCLGNGANQTTEAPGPPAEAGRVTGRKLSETEREIVAVLEQAERPLKARTVTGRAGLHYGSYTRGLLAKMVRDGILSRVSGGYWLPGRPLSATKN